MSGKSGVVAEMAEGVLQKMVSSILVLRETPRGAGKLLTDVISLKDEIEYVHAKVLEMGYSESNMEEIRCCLYDCNELVDQICTVAKVRQRKQSLILKAGWGWCGSNCCFATECFSFDSKEVRIMSVRFRHIKAADVPGFAVPSSIGRDDDTNKIEAAEVIGRVEDSDNIVNMLLHSGHARCPNDHISVISIFGMQGLGKTTLANYVCSDARITSRFHPILLVCLDYEFQLPYIIKKMVEDQSGSGTSEEHSSLDLQQLQSRLQQIIIGKRFLLVLDNVWSYDSDNWCKLLKLLSTGSPDSAILTTTRSQKLASTMSFGKTTTYKLEPLTNEHSWSLFQRLAFQQGVPITDSDFAAIGESIVKKTGNVPRTIKFAAKELLSQPKSKWQLAESNWETFLLDPSSGVTDRQLSYPLKRCLAYFAIYPTNHTINKCHLIHLWIALGFVHHPLNDKHQTLEEAGEEYFMNLQNWSLFKHVRNDDKGNIIFSMHQIPLDQARSMAGSETMVFQDSTTTIPDKAVYHLLFDSRHLSVGNSGSATSSSSNTSLKELILSVPAQLRSFLMVPRSTMDLTKSDYDKLFSRLKHLRALDLHGSKMEVVPNSIGSLKQLRYLNLSDNDFPSLPNSITKLSNLQVLDLSNCKFLRELPRLLRRLESLRHLYLGGCNSLIGMPAGIGGMTSLQTLSHFVLSKGQNSCKLDELNRLNLKAELTFVFACKQQP